MWQSRKLTTNAANVGHNRAPGRSTAFANAAREEMRRHVIFKCERKSRAVDRCTKHDLHAINDWRSVHGDGEGLTALIELPAVHARGPVSKVDTPPLPI